jgi:hypothetical protein
MRAKSGKVWWLIALLMATPTGYCQSPDDTVVKARVALAIVRFAEMPKARVPGPLQLCLAVNGPAPQSILGLAWHKVGPQRSTSIPPSHSGVSCWRSPGLPR